KPALHCGAVRGTKRLPFAGYSIDRASARRSLTLLGTIEWSGVIWTHFTVGPQAPFFTFPVVIGERSHPFPFRSGKLSSLPPMVLRGKLRGRVGHCRDYFHRLEGSSHPRRAFFHVPPRAARPLCGRGGSCARIPVLQENAMAHTYEDLKAK